MRAGIQNQFPQLLGIGFELVRASGQGYGSLLTRIQHSTPVPGVSAIIKSRATQVYVRPFQEIIAEVRGKRGFILAGSALKLLFLTYLGII